MKSACFRRLTPLLLPARGAMLRATHVASVSRQDCRALFAKLSDVEHQLEPCDDGRRAAVRLKRDSNTVPKCPAAAGRGEHQASRGPWVVSGDVGRWGRAGWRTRGRCVAHTRAMRGVGAGYGLVHPRVLTAWEGRLCVGRARGVLPCSRALSRSLREQGRAWTVDEGRQNTRGAWMAAAEKARGAEARGPRRRRRSARLDGDEGSTERARRTATRGR